MTLRWLQTLWYTLTTRGTGSVGVRTAKFNSKLSRFGLNGNKLAAKTTAFAEFTAFTEFTAIIVPEVDTSSRGNHALDSW
jgi:hypothetical protein